MGGTYGPHSVETPPAVPHRWQSSGWNPSSRCSTPAKTFQLHKTGNRMWANEQRCKGSQTPKLLPGNNKPFSRCRFTTVTCILFTVFFQKKQFTVVEKKGGPGSVVILQGNMKGKGSTTTANGLKRRTAPRQCCVLPSGIQLYFYCLFTVCFQIQHKIPTKRLGPWPL